jgi:hypothetical protein
VDYFETAPDEDLQSCDFPDKTVESFTARTPILDDVVGYFAVCKIEESNAFPFVAVGTVIESLHSTEKGAQLLPVRGEMEDLSRPHSHPGFKVRELGTINGQGFHGTAGPSATAVSEGHREGSSSARTAGVPGVVPQEGTPPGESFQRSVRENHGGIVHGFPVLVLELVQLRVEVTEIGLSQTLGGGIDQGLKQPSPDGYGEARKIASMVGSFQKIDGGKTTRQFCVRNPCQWGTPGVIEKPAKLLHLGRGFGLTLLTDEAESDGVVHVGAEAFPTFSLGGTLNQ